RARRACHRHVIRPGVTIRRVSPMVRDRAFPDPRRMSHNPIRPWRNIDRRRSRQIHVGPVAVGGGAPISVQTMTNTLTTDVKGTIAQVQAAAEAGADIVRVSVPDEASSRALREIVHESPVPIVADIHFHYRRAIESAEAGAACLRIN